MSAPETKIDFSEHLAEIATFYRGFREVKATVSHCAGTIEIEMEGESRYLFLTPAQLREIADWAEKEKP